MKKLEVYIVAGVLILTLAGAFVAFRLIGADNDVVVFKDESVLRLDGKNGFAATVKAAHDLFPRLYENEGIVDPFGSADGVRASGFSAVVVKDGQGYRIRSMQFAVSFLQQGKIYTQHFDVDADSASSYLMSTPATSDSLPDAPAVMDLAAGLDKMDLKAEAACLPECDAYSIDLMARPARQKTVYEIVTNYGGGSASVGNELYIQEDILRMEMKNTVYSLIFPDGGTATVWDSALLEDEGITVALVALRKNEMGGYAGEKGVEVKLIH